MVGVTKGSIQNWEGGLKRPSPQKLQALARLAPQFRRDIDALLATFEWHPKRAEQSAREEIVGLAALLPEGMWDEINDRANRKRKTLAEVCAALLESGLHAEVEEMAEEVRSSPTRRQRKKAS